MKVKDSLRRLFKKREFFIITAVALLFIAMSFVNPIFISFSNIHVLLIGIANEAIIAVGMTIIMICGDIDLSVGSNMALSSALGAVLILNGMPVFWGIAASIMCGVLVGAFNGFFVSYARIAPFIITLATTNITRGLLYGFTRGTAIVGLPADFTVIGQGSVGGIQYPIIVMFVVLILGQFLLSKTRFMRQSYYIGGNQKAALLSGINIVRTKFIYFIFSGALCGLAGVLLSARYGSVTTTMGTGVELRVITAVVVGGASMSGGQGSIVGTFFGAVLMAAITNILNLQGADIYWQTFITGLTLFVAVSIDQINIIRKRRSALKEAEKMLRKYEQQSLHKEA